MMNDREIPAGSNRHPVAHRIAYLLISIFIVWNILTIVTVALPDSKLRREAHNVVDLYLFVTGLDQKFMLFSPNIDTATADLVADVMMSDGSVKTWHYPSVGRMNLIERLFQNRYLSYTFVLQQPRFRFLLPGTARHIAQVVYEQTGKSIRPTTVVLKFVWQQTKPAESDETPRSGKTEILRYLVQRQDLE